jgi:uridine kinase
MTASYGALQKADKAFTQQLEKVAKSIQKTAIERPVILLSGPSGSGKTTTSFLLKRLLGGFGLETHTISMDNFFRTMTPEQNRLAAMGKLDLESPDRVDVPYLNAQLKKVISGEPTWIPKYDFTTTTSQDQDWLLTRNPGELLILEGIHALNPKVITVPDPHTVRLYVSVRTRVTCGETVLHPSRLRLMRRMLRDRNFRDRSLSDTLAMFQSVQAGEHKYITPYKTRATHSIDTFLPYELGVYKSELQEAIQDCLGHPILKELLEMWDSITPLSLERVPSDSLVREFAGESSFQY